MNLVQDTKIVRDIINDVYAGRVYENKSISQNLINMFRDFSDFLTEKFNSKDLTDLNKDNTKIDFISYHFPEMYEYLLETESPLFMNDPISSLAGIMNYLFFMFDMSLTFSMFYKETDEGMIIYPVVAFNEGIYLVDFTTIGFFPKKITLIPISTFDLNGFNLVTNSSVLFSYLFIVPSEENFIAAFLLSMFDVICVNKEFFEGFNSLKEKNFQFLEEVIKKMVKEEKVDFFIQKLKDFYNTNKKIVGSTL